MLILDRDDHTFKTSHFRFWLIEVWTLQHYTIWIDYDTLNKWGQTMWLVVYYISRKIKSHMVMPSKHRTCFSVFGIGNSLIAQFFVFALLDTIKKNVSKNNSVLKAKWYGEEFNVKLAFLNLLTSWPNVIYKFWFSAIYIFLRTVILNIDCLEVL